ncbi:MAG: SMP-30/gluconolactonase/LRE family protein [Anaerolineae bacterium]|nr:SMP-30/gluconolactonase/LRE family protein [Anaerolineae bacterium]
MPDGTSFYTVRFDDPLAVYLEPAAFGVAGDGAEDDTDALQAAINAAQEATGFGIVFVPEGRYRLSRTVHVWAGIRLIGYGAQRPVFLLGDDTPGFQEGEGRYMLHFTSGRPPAGQPVRDANPGTFYSALSNIDIEIGAGNSAAIGVRSHWAQHCYVAHVDFRTGSGRAGVEQVGNEIDDCRFFGGDYGIVTTKPSPSWPFLMIDSVFEGQRVAAIRTEEGGLTLVRNRFAHVPTVVTINPDRAEELFIIDSRFEDITGPALVISDEDNARSQVTLENVVCDRVPLLAFLRRSGGEVAGMTGAYHVSQFTSGLHIDDIGGIPEMRAATTMQKLRSLPAPVPSDVPALPPCETWVNVHTLGVRGDGVTDDTQALRDAIASHRALYLPTGRYKVTDTLTLRPDTVLVGLSPIATQIVVPDDTPAFQGAVALRKPPEAPPWLAAMMGATPKPGEPPRRRMPRWGFGPPPAIEGPPKPLLETPPGGTNIVTGIGLDPGATNGCAVAAKWCAGAASMMNDVRFMGGHGMAAADGSRVQPYNDSRTADADPNHVWDAQYWSLWITDGGGGTFKDIWTPSPYAHAGVCVSNTDTPGRIYAMSVEHHVRNEVILRNVANWRIVALQLEEESAEGPNALPVELDRCRNLTFANLYLYRVIRMVTPFPYGVRMTGCRDIAFHGVHVYSPTKFSYDATVFDATHSVEVRSREIARMSVSGRPPVLRAPGGGSVLAPDGVVERIAGGYSFIDGATVDGQGNVYFVDGRRQSIYRWSAERDAVELVSDIPIAPVSLACDRSGRLLVVARTGTVLSIDPESPADVRVVPGMPAAERPGAVALLPGHRWRDGHDFLTVSQARPDEHFVSPDGSIFIPGSPDLVRAFSLRPAVVGQPFYLADEFGQKTWAFDVRGDGSLSAPRLFAEEGELGVTVDAEGKVFVAAGDILVYDTSGRQIDRLEVPERPATLVFGGTDGRTLFVTARSSLYRVRMDVPGLM